MNAVIRKADPDRVRQLAAEGHSQSTIALIVGVSRERIRQICDRDGIETVSGKVDWDRREKLAEFVGKNITAKDAAKAVGYSSGAAAFRSNGLPPPRREAWHDRYRGCAEVGMTLSETARKFGHSVQRVWIECKRAGVTFTARERAASKNGHNIKWTDEMRAELVRRRDAGETLAAMAREYGVSHGAIWQQVAKVKA